MSDTKDILLKPDKVEEKEELKSLTVQITEETREILLHIQEFYRSPSISHTVRLMIEDVGAMIKSPEVNVFSRGLGKNENE